MTKTTLLDLISELEWAKKDPKNNDARLSRIQDVLEDELRAQEAGR